MQIRLAMFAAALVLTGCGLVGSEFPLSTDEDSVADERLIGWWREHPDHVPDDLPEDEKVALPLAIGRKPGSKRTLEFVCLEFEDKEVRVLRFALFPTKIGKHRYLSVPVPAREGDVEVTAYMLCRYALDDGVLVVETLDKTAVGRLVEAGEVKGSAVRGRGWTKEAPYYKHVALEAPTAELRAWLPKAGDAIWAKDPTRLKKIHLREPEGDE